MSESNVWLDDVLLQEIGMDVLLDSEEPPLPSTRDTTLVIPGQHGALDGGAYLEPRPFLLHCKIERQASYNELKRAVEKLVDILIDPYGRPKTVTLRFGDDPDRFFNVRYSGSISLERLARMGDFKLPLTAFKPFANFVEEADEYTWGDDIPFLSDVPFEQTPYTYTVTAAKTLTIQNFGKMAIRPVIEITGSATSLTLAVNGKSFSFGAFSNATFTVDGERYTVIKNGQSALSLMAGNFIELMPGDNTVSVSGSGLNVEINFVFRPQYKV